MVLEAYKLALQSNKASDIIFIGDSAGGGLMISFTMLLQDQNIELPSKLIGLSPWVDASMTNPNAANLERRIVPGHQKTGSCWWHGD